MTVQSLEHAQERSHRIVDLLVAANRDRNRMSKGKRKKSALIITTTGRRFWTTQTQFWQWARDGVIVKTNDCPLSGIFSKEHEDKTVVLSNTVLNLERPNHLREVLTAKRRFLRPKKA